MKLSREKIAEKAEEIFFQQSLAEDGDPEAQNILGAKLASGNFVEKDEFGGLYWYCQALKKGYVNAKWNAGSMFLKGDGGVPKNTELAMMLIEEAAEEGDNGASHFLSICYAKGGYGKEVDIESSNFWREKASSGCESQEYGKQIDLESKKSTSNQIILIDMLLFLIHRLPV